MSEVWKRVTKQDPCPVCEKPDWCQIGDFVVKCMRVESPKSCPSGGWYHNREGVKSQTPPPRMSREPDRAPISAGRMVREWKSATFPWQVEALAASLGVLPHSLIAMDACWSTIHNAWAFPMRDGHGEPVGIRFRSVDGDKWSLSGSKQGVFVPSVQPLEPVAYLVEGPTDCAAVLTMGAFPIGRASCNCAADQIDQTLRRLKISRAVIVADMDEIDPKTGKRPGMVGAMKLKKELKVTTALWVATSKDFREMVKLGADKAFLDSQINNLKWRRGE